MKILNWEISPEKLCLISNPPPCISWSWPRIRIPCTEDIYYIWQVRTWRNGLFFWNSNFLILVSFHPSYFKLWVLLDQIVKVCPNKSFHQQGAKIKGFENQSSRRLNSFLIFFFVCICSSAWFGLTLWIRYTWFVSGQDKPWEKKQNFDWTILF